MQTASKGLQETLSEVYEGEWPGHEQLYVQGQNSEMLWADLAHKLSDQVLIPLKSYQGQFPEMRVSILGMWNMKYWDSILIVLSIL